MRQASLHWRGRPSEKITVNSVGIWGYSSMIFTPPSDMSEIMQSRGNPPVANCIFAKLLHARRSLLRRFAYMSIPDPARCYFTRWWISFTEELLELAYRNGSQCTGCVRTPFTEPGALAEGRAPRTCLRGAIFGKLKG